MESVTVYVYSDTTPLQVTVSATSDELATYGLEAVAFDYDLLSRSEEAAKRGEYHSLKETLTKLRARRRA